MKQKKLSGTVLIITTVSIKTMDLINSNVDQTICVIISSGIDGFL